MRRIGGIFLLFIGVIALMSAGGCQPNIGQCLHQSQEVAPLSLEVENLNGRLHSGLYHQKIDNLLVIIDDTTSMASCFDGYAKRQMANVLMTRMVRTIPDIKLVKGIRIYGPKVNADLQNTSLTHGMGLSPTTKLRAQILTRTTSDSIYNPLAMALEGAYHELKWVNGSSAIILISDFKDPKKEIIRTAELIKQYYGDRVCLYPVVIGNDGTGRNSAENVTAAVGCGMTAMADSLELGRDMADFMEKIIFDKHEKIQPAPAPIRKNPATDLSYQQLVKEQKLTIELKTEFDFDKAIIRPEYMAHLQKIAKFMKTYPDTVTTIEGHTCSIGTEKYNIGLSRRRAMSVKKHLAALGIDEKRLSIASYGETRPMADNSTEEGRRKNRRAVAVITTTISN